MSKSHLRTGVSRCCFTFFDGRRCRSPLAGHPRLCYFHAEREAKARAAAEVGRDVAAAFSGDYVSAIGLSVALARTIAATAQGHFGPRTASAIARLGQTLMRAIEYAEHEYAESRGPDAWRQAVRSTCARNDDGPDSAPSAPPAPSASSSESPAPASVEKEGTQPIAASEAASERVTENVAASPSATGGEHDAPSGEVQTPFYSLAKPRRRRLPIDASAFASQVLASSKESRPEAHSSQPPQR
jgi:HEPN domain-containing protein